MALTIASGFDALPSFDRINLGSTLLQGAVIIAFAAAQVGTARHFDRPAMRRMATVWCLYAVAAFVNIFSSWAGAVWNDRMLSRAATTLMVALLGAAVPVARDAMRVLASSDQPGERLRDESSRWALSVLVLHAVGVFGSAMLWPDLRVITVTWSRLLHLLVLCAPMWMAWQAWRTAAQNRAVLGLLAGSFAGLAVRQLLAVVLGLRVGLPDLPFSMVVASLLIDVLGVMVAGVCSLLASTAEEVTLVNAQAQEIARAQAQLAAAQRMESLGRMAAGVAHDMNNVLQVVAFAVETFRAEARAADLEDLERADAAMQHGRSLTKQLMTFARVQPEAPTRFDPAERLRAITALLKAMTGPIIDISVSATADGATLRMEPAQFEQIVINLVANARDAVTAGGHIRVQLDMVAIARNAPSMSLEPGDYVRLLVEDNGTGMPPEVSAHIFEPFFTTKEPGRGTGLGLATVHGITRQAAGAVRLDSVQGRGTSFEVLLPAA